MRARSVLVIRDGAAYSIVCPVCKLATERARTRGQPPATCQARECMRRWREARAMVTAHERARAAEARAASAVFADRQLALELDDGASVTVTRPGVQ